MIVIDELHRCGSLGVGQGLCGGLQIGEILTNPPLDLSPELTSNRLFRYSSHLQLRLSRASRSSPPRDPQRKETYLSRHHRAQRRIRCQEPFDFGRIKQGWQALYRERYKEVDHEWGLL